MPPYCHFSEDMIYPKGRPFTCLVYTNISEIPHLTDLISALPKVQFKIASRQHVTDKLAQFDYLSKCDSLLSHCRFRWARFGIGAY